MVGMCLGSILLWRMDVCGIVLSRFVRVVRIVLCVVDIEFCFGVGYGDVCNVWRYLFLFKED